MPVNRKGSAVTALLGAQWGDEGKGKVIDYLIEKYEVDISARCQGGHNAGHTVIANGHKYDFHILPSGMVSEKCMNIIGNGTIVSLDAFFAELAHNGIADEPRWEKRIMISAEAHLVFDCHTQFDGRRDASLKKEKIGTTGCGIGPAYASKCFRNGIRVADLMGDFEQFVAKYRKLNEFFLKMLPSIKVNTEEELNRLKNHREALRSLKLVGDTVGYLHKARMAGQSILVEGANGTLLDKDFGSYPFVTSSNASVGGVCTGLGLPPTCIQQVIGVVKAFQTRLATGPFPTEDLGPDGETLLTVGKEFGVNTGEKRRCGWLDLVMLHRSTIINGFTNIALTKLDVLDAFKEVKVGVAYKINGKVINAPPARANDWAKIEVVYKVLPGWMSETKNVTKYDDLPENCRAFVQFIEEFIDVPVKWIGVGPERESIIERD